MFIWYPAMRRGNEWLQVSNPTVKTELAGGVEGYEVSLSSYLINKHRCNKLGQKHAYGSSGPERGKSWTNVTFGLKVSGCYGQRKAKVYTPPSPTI